MKPLYNHSKTTTKEGAKFIDPAKPMRAYINFVTNGKGKKINSHTKIYGPGDKKTSPFRCLDVHGSCHPVVHWDDIHWGAHGQNSYGASVRLRVTEMNFSPCVLERSLPSRRKLGPVNKEESEYSEDEIILQNYSDDSVFDSD